MPTDSANGLPIYTQVCQTFNEYGTSTVYYSPVVTSTVICYNARDEYINIGIEGLFIVATLIGLVWLLKVMHKGNNINYVKM